MAAMEHLDDLPMTTLESLLHERLLERPEVSERILTPEEMSDYVTWMARTYGQKHRKVTESMIPFFTPDNGMTGLAMQLTQNPGNLSLLQKLTRELGEQSDEGFIPSGQDISVGRMLRFFPSQWHTTTYVTVYYAFSGNCPIHFQNEVVTLRQGSVMIVAPTIVHATPCYAEDAVLAFCMIRASTFQRVFWNSLGDDNLLSRFFRLALSSDQPTAYLHFETEGDAEIRHLMLEIYREHQLDEPYAQQMIHSLMRLLFLLILRRYEGTARLPRTESLFWKHQFSAILSEIQTNYAQISLAQLAEKYHYSTKQVGRIVKDCTGENFGDLIRTLKMKKAAELLRDRRFTPEDTAVQVGYATVNSFYRAFTGYYGMPPQEWLEGERSRRMAER